MSEAFFPATLAEALSVRAGGDVIPYAGGTDLMVKRRRHSGVLPAFDKPVLYIGRIPELRLLDRTAGGGIRIGAAVTLTEILESSETPDLLKQAVKEIAVPGIRNIGTLAGNICNASPAADAVPALIVLDAELVLASVRGNRTVKLADFATGPGKTLLAADELVTEILIPAVPPDAVFYYRKIGTRKAQALSKVSLAGFCRVEGSSDVRIGEIRIAVGAAGPTVLTFPDIESRLKGMGLRELKDVIGEIAAEISRGVSPIDDQRSTADYRRMMSRELAGEFLGKVVAGLGRSGKR